MRIVRYAGQEGPRWGIVSGERVTACDGVPFDLRPREEVGSLADLRLLAPAAPTKIICVGRNYRSHAEEFGNPVPEEPLLFMKPPSSIVGPGDEIHYPVLSKRVDPEAELVVVIGQPAHRVSADEAAGFIGGYTCGNDVTARDIQKSDGQWTRGKGFHTFCPIGPWIETELEASDVRVTCTVDGELRQDGSTRDLIFPIPYLVEYISRFTRLEPGDLIMTGTPEGVAPVQVGQEIVVAVEGIGELRNAVVAEPPAGR